MKQGVLNHNSANQAVQMQNGGNALIGKGQSKASFAKEMSSLQNANQLIHSENPELAKNMDQGREMLTPQEEVTKFKSAVTEALKNQGMDFDNLPPEIKEKLAMMQDAVKQEAAKRQGQDESKRSAEDLQNKFSSNESSVANAGQENQKHITDAVREGNVGEQQQQAQDSSDERKEQLANWEDLAPKVIEDPKNRAVRIDIPGLAEVETIIVRMNGNKVSIQTVGDGKTMQKLQAREQELVSKLSAHNISLDTLKTFDSKALNKGRGG